MLLSGTKNIWSSCRDNNNGEHPWRLDLNQSISTKHSSYTEKQCLRVKGTPSTTRMDGKPWFEVICKLTSGSVCWTGPRSDWGIELCVISITVKPDIYIWGMSETENKQGQIIKSPENNFSVHTELWSRLYLKAVTSELTQGLWSDTQ